jgi:YVTN family beta-propeller protein
MPAWPPKVQEGDLNDRYKHYRNLVLPSIVAALLVAAAGASSTEAGYLPLTTVADVPLSGHTTRWDYASLDPASHHLFIAHLGDSVVTVFDTVQQKVIADISGVSHVHGVLFVPALNRVYATATGTDELVVIDPKTFKIVARVPAGDYPDGMAYAPEAHKLYVSDEHGGSDTVIDVRSNTRVATIPLGGEVGNTQYDPVSKHIFANVQTRQQLVEIDPTMDKVVSRLNLPGAEGNHGLYIDAASHLAFIACEGNSKLLVLDLASRRVHSTFDVAKDPDVLAFDAPLGWLYVAGESGDVSLFKVHGQAVSKLGTAWLGPNAHVVAVDPTSHRAYFPLKDLKGETVLRITQAQP